ncbi:D-alanyl-D-alanine carboxypeptidase [Streptomyces longispororuber]|uniref:D-alanyl-D-alanine carboxypeptidase n=1 Tax=Streptomyces longispororuber TaxID=68230 RepID=A0A918ZZ98_9ACTN|nr:D-alanyl-D-alanine carboxypeptidase [Streptomyces longispororuber]GHE80051.1 D-alanyl-D-alanine carboxypeptidase [Streptomyces longispororuber]
MTTAVITAPAQAATPPKPSIAAKGGFLMNSGTGKTLFTKSADSRLKTGSTTKIMTAYTVLTQRNLNLNTKVKYQKAYSDYIVRNGASSAKGLIVGDRATVRDLLYGLMLPSGCDAAYALADKYGSGSSRGARVKSFIGKMNKNARDLGLRNTHFDSFDGISNGANYSSPRDLTKLTVKAMKNSTFRSLVKTKSYKAKPTMPNGGTRGMPTWENTNKLLGSYRGAIGVKTGSGSQAKYNLVFAATRNGKTLVGSVLMSSSKTSRYTDAKKVLDYGFKVA